MKTKLTFTFLLISISGMLMAQSVKIKRIKKVNIDEVFYFAQFGANQNQLLLSGKNYQGITLLNLRNKKTMQISNKVGVGRQLSVAESGVLSYSENANGNKKSKTFTSYNLNTGKSLPINTRELKATVQIKGKELKIYNMGEERTIAPIKDKYYLWASLSPDKTNVLFTIAGGKTYICDLNGNIKKELPTLNAPKWVNNQWIVGMKDKDDGHEIQESDVFLVHWESGVETNVTVSSDVKAVYPAVSPEGNRLVFTTPQGEVYQAKIKLKNK